MKLLEAEKQVKTPKVKYIDHIAFHSSESVEQLVFDKRNEALERVLAFAEKEQISVLSLMNVETLFHHNPAVWMCDLKERLKKGFYENWGFYFFGDLNAEEKTLQEEIEAHSVQKSHHVWIGVRYRGRKSVLKALLKMLDNGLSACDVTPELVSSYCAGSEKDPQVFIFMDGSRALTDSYLWELAYAEFLFSDLSFDQLNSERLYELLTEYISREKRYGK